ncbi:tripartite tricarboxylate transporter TctB family protein [Sagittula sp. SSi028]|uniref:tripartite tricarboxylate transporter TctB family protein n=1 Tax=Sagittula sp. SSi028 TaxID=3400636 RepID=UPI003AF47E01
MFLYIMLAVSVGYLVTALGLGAPITEDGLTPAFFPLLVGAAAIFFCSLLIMQALRAEDDAQNEPCTEKSTTTHIWVVVAIFLYIVAFKPLGYFLSSFLFVTALILLFSSFEKLILKLAISAAIVAIAFGLFQQLFGVRLPTLWG